VSSSYGRRTGGAFSFHYGADFVGYSALRAILPGKVTQVGHMNSNAGNVVVIDSIDPVTRRKVTIVRMHVASWSVYVGQTVSEGQIIGAMGDTGNASGRCDHVEIRYWSGDDFTTSDPVAWLKARVTPPRPTVAGTIKKAVNAIRYPKVSVKTLGRIGDVRGLQKIATKGGYTGRIDNKWGPRSQAGFQKWLDRNYGGSVLTWLRNRWGYTGDAYQGPVMTAALRRANAENNRVL